MFRIGDFSRLSRVPVKTLRYYDEIGLLKPRGIDRFTRYRYYSVDQLPLLYRILGLKELGFSLEQIARLLEGDISPGQLRRMLEVRRGEIEQQLEQGHYQLKRLEARLKQIEQEGKMPDYEVILKKVDPRWVASVRGVISSYDESGPVFDRLFDEAYSYVHRQGVRSPGCGIAVYHEKQGSDENIEVEALAELPGSIPGSSQVQVYELPAIETAASMVHHGLFATLGKAYAAILAWTQEHGYRVSGPARELYLSFQKDGDQNQYVTEIQLPVMKIQQRKAAVEPEIVNLEAFLVVGLPYLGDNEGGEIGQMWGEFVPRIPEIRHLAPGPAVSYGICSPNPTGLIDYIAALPVTRLEDIPPGMVGKQVPAQTYVRFEARGVEDIGPTYQRILKEWLPASGYQPGDGPDFEFYPETFNPDDPESTVYIYFPVQKA